MKSITYWNMFRAHKDALLRALVRFVLGDISMAHVNPRHYLDLPLLLMEGESVSFVL